MQLTCDICRGPPPHNVVHWGHPFETPRYNEVTLWWRGCVEPGHHSISLVLVGVMCREVFWEITEIQNEKEPQHNLCAAPNFHLGGGSYCDSASPVHCIKFLPCMVFRPFRVCKSCNPAHFGCYTLREPRYLLLVVFQESIRRRQPSSHFSNTFIIKSCQFHCTCPACPVRMGANPIQRDIPAGIT